MLYFYTVTLLQFESQFLGLSSFMIELWMNKVFFVTVYSIIFSLFEVFLLF
jgi:hypothetical protein